MRDLIYVSISSFSGVWREVVFTTLVVAVSFAIPLGLVLFGLDLRRGVAEDFVSPSDGAALHVTAPEHSPALLTSDRLHEFLDLPHVRVASGEVTLPGVVSYAGRDTAASVRIVEVMRRAELPAESSGTAVVASAELVMALGVSSESLVGTDVSLVIFPADADGSGAQTVRVSSGAADFGAPRALRVPRSAVPLTPIPVFTRATLELDRPDNAPLVSRLLAERGFLSVSPAAEAARRIDGFFSLASLTLGVFSLLALMFFIPWFCLRLTTLLALRARSLTRWRATHATSSSVRALILGESALIGGLGGALERKIPGEALRPYIP
ncbi:MAG: hypothetical protein HY536_02060 [Candidatus Colwellbacteria bacterium]|nr:hypothetical protein [Candidatus Colwellbacteria bacterium]